MFNWLKKNKGGPEVLPGNNELTPKEKASSEPLVTIIGQGVDSEKGIGIKLDWNDAFIKYLKANGYNGADEQLIVGKWLIDLQRHLAAKMNEGTQKYE